MPSPWSPGDNVQVRVSDNNGTPIWCNAVVDMVHAPGKYCCTITDDPRPTLTECGKTSRYVDGSVQIKALICAVEASNTITNIDDTIRDPV